MKAEVPVFRALSALLTYPRPELLDALPELSEVISGSTLVPETEKSRLAELIAELSRGEPLELEERYVELFDRGRATSLHLFEHLHGESRDRGTAMVDLVQIYGAAGFELAPNELPDYLPALLEYLSCRTLEEARAMLGDCAHIVRRIGEALAQRGSRYAAVPSAILAAAREEGLDWSKAATPPSAGPALDEAQLDQEWADAPAFGPASGDAPQSTVVQFMKKP